MFDDEPLAGDVLITAELKEVKLAAMIYLLQWPESGGGPGGGHG